MSVRMWINETIAFASGVVIASYILRTAVESWWSVVLFIVLASGIATVVDGASNGTLRLAMALDEAFGELKARIKELESSLERLERQRLGGWSAIWRAPCGIRTHGPSLPASA